MVSVLGWKHIGVRKPYSIDRMKIDYSYLKSSGRLDLKLFNWAHCSATLYRNRNYGNTLAVYPARFYEHVI